MLFLIFLKRTKNYFNNMLLYEKNIYCSFFNINTSVNFTDFKN